MAYVDRDDDIKPYLRIPADVTTDDELLDRLILAAQNLIEAPSPIGTGRVWEAASATIRKFDAVRDLGDSNLELRWFDLDCCEITAIENGDGTTIPGSAYVTIPRRRTPFYGVDLLRGGSYVWTYDDTPEEAISVTGFWAFSKTPPAYIKQIAIRIVAWMYRQQDGSISDVPIDTGSTVIYPSGFPKDIKEALAGYRSLV